MKKEIHQKKLPSHRNIKKSTGRGNIRFSWSIFFLILTTVKSSKEKKIKTVIKQTEKTYNTRDPCYISYVLKCVKHSHSSLVDVKAGSATT